MKAADEGARLNFFGDVSDGGVRMIGRRNVVEREKHPRDDLRQAKIKQSRSKHVGHTGAARDRFTEHSPKGR